MTRYWSRFAEDGQYFRLRLKTSGERRRDRSLENVVLWGGLMKRLKKTFCPNGDWGSALGANVWVETSNPACALSTKGV